VLLVFRLSAGGRDPRRSVALIVLLAVGLGVVVPIVVGAMTPPGAGFEAQLLTPTAWTAFLLTACLASIAAAGGRELLPRDRAVSFPVSAAADHLGALTLTPLNVAWSIQAVGLATLTAYGVGSGPTLLPALAATVVWIVAATAVGQLVGWLSELVRTFRFGRQTLWLLAGASTVATVLLVASGQTISLLDRLPTTAVYVGAITPDLGRYVLTQLAVMAVAVVAVVAAVPLAEQLSRRPGLDRGRTESRRRRRREQPASTFWAAVAGDVRSVVRSPPLSRGLALMVLTPLGIAALVELPWSAVILLPGLVAAGTGLLYGVNAAALDGHGALWRESLPGRPDVRFWARSTALALICACSAIAVATTAALRTASGPTLAEAAAVVAAVVVATAQVVTRCAVWSMRHPFATALQHPRDTPAPPARMAGYSLQLSGATTLASVLLIAASLAGLPALVLLTGTLLVIPAVYRQVRALRLHRDLAVRSVVASTVSGT